MPKISLITLHSVQNYGSALQTYASEMYFRKLGYDVEIVDFVRTNNLKENLVDTALMHSGFWNKNIFTRTVFKIIKSGDLKKRYDIFDKFVHKYVSITPHRYLCDEDFEKYPIDADIYCTGSDQTWNTYWNRGFIAPYYLSYAKKNAKKISYAASFGKAQLDNDEKAMTKELLSQYDSITVREHTGVEILKDLGIQSHHILDPTLMLTKEDWAKAASKPMIKEKYMLIYQLGHNKEFDSCAKKLAKEKNLRLIRVGFSKESLMYCGKVIINPDVFEFLSLMINADYIITDSFHATSFATNLNVRFFTWLPKAFTGRITSFLDVVGLQDRVFDNYQKLTELYNSDIDFNSVNNKLDQERVRCADIIKSMLD